MSLWTLLRGRFSSSNENDIDEVRIDGSTNSLQTIDYAHHEIHAGSSFVLSQRSALNALDIAAPLTFELVTPAGTKLGHLSISGEANVPAFWELFEDDGDTDHYSVSGGVAQVAVNRNRSKVATLATITAKNAVTVTKAEPNVLMDTEAVAKAGASGDRHEFVLKAGTKYLIRLTSYVESGTSFPP